MRTFRKVERNKIRKEVGNRNLRAEWEKRQMYYYAKTESLGMKLYIKMRLACDSGRRSVCTILNELFAG